MANAKRLLALAAGVSALVPGLGTSTPAAAERVGAKQRADLPEGAAERPEEDRHDDPEGIDPQGSRVRCLLRWEPGGRAAPRMTIVRVGSPRYPLPQDRQPGELLGREQGEGTGGQPLDGSHSSSSGTGTVAAYWPPSGTAHDGGVRE